MSCCHDPSLFSRRLCMHNSSFHAQQAGHYSKVWGMGRAREDRAPAGRRRRARAPGGAAWWPPWGGVREGGGAVPAAGSRARPAAAGCRRRHGPCPPHSRPSARPRSCRRPRRLTPGASIRHGVTPNPDGWQACARDADGAAHTRSHEPSASPSCSFRCTRRLCAISWRLRKCPRPDGPRRVSLGLAVRPIHVARPRRAHRAAAGRPARPAGCGGVGAAGGVAAFGSCPDGRAAMDHAIWMSRGPMGDRPVSMHADG
jgi:hypothetical protein